MAKGNKNTGTSNAGRGGSQGRGRGRSRGGRGQRGSGGGKSPGILKALKKAEKKYEKQKQHPILFQLYHSVLNHRSVPSSVLSQNPRQQHPADESAQKTFQVRGAHEGGGGLLPKHPRLARNLCWGFYTTNRRGKGERARRAYTTGGGITCCPLRPPPALCVSVDWMLGISQPSTMLLDATAGFYGCYECAGQFSSRIFRIVWVGEWVWVGWYTPFTLYMYYS